MQQADSTLAMIVMTMLLFLFAMMGTGAWWVAQTDPWLGALTAWWLLRLLWTRSPFAFEFCLYWTVACVALTAIRSLSPDNRALAVRLALWGACAQAVLSLLQVADLDPVWANSDGLVMGTLGNTAYVACLLAAFVPVASMPVALILLTTIALAHAKVPFLAALIGVAVQQKRWGFLGVGVLGSLLILYNVDGGSWDWRGAQWQNSGNMRLTIWYFALSNLDLTHWLIGVGPAQWNEPICQVVVNGTVEFIGRIPCLQMQAHVLEGHSMTWAHSEWVQTVFEGGLVALALVCGWLWSNREMFSSPYAGSVVAMLVMSTAWFIFHNANMALPMLVLLGAAMSPLAPQRPPPDSSPSTLARP